MYSNGRIRTVTKLQFGKNATVARKLYPSLGMTVPANVCVAALMIYADHVNRFIRKIIALSDTVATVKNVSGAEKNYH